MRNPAEALDKQRMRQQHKEIHQKWGITFAAGEYVIGEIHLF